MRSACHLVGGAVSERQPFHGRRPPTRARGRPRREVAPEPDHASADPGPDARAETPPTAEALAEAQRRNAERTTLSQRQAALEGFTWRAVERLGELLEHEDPHVVLAAARELLERSPLLPASKATQAPARVTADDVEHEWERRRLRPRIFKGGAEALGG
jgi:hypothetical protein